MEQMNLGLPFFAKLIQADVSDLSYAIVKRKYNDGHSAMFPCLRVDGIKNYVFDLITGQFVELGKRSDSTLKAEKADIVNTENGILLRTKQGHSIPYTNREFRKCYCFRIINSVLYK